MNSCPPIRRMPKQLFSALPLCMLFFLGCWAPSSRGEDPEIRILSYNIHHGEGVDGKLDLERIARVIRDANPDLVALQEVDQGTSRTGKVDQAAELARLCKMKMVFGANLQYGGGQYGNAILSRHPIKNSQNRKLPNRSAREPRGVLWAEITIDGIKNPIHFYATHFDHVKDPSNRIDSAKAIDSSLPKNPVAWTFLAGDINDVIGSQPLKILEKRWLRSNNVVLPTIPVKKPTRQIDFVFSLRDQAARCVQSKVLKESVASDHRAFLAVFRLRN